MPWLHYGQSDIIQDVPQCSNLDIRTVSGIDLKFAGGIGDSVLWLMSRQLSVLRRWSVVVNLLFMYFPLFVGVLCLYLFCNALLCVHSLHDLQSS